MLPGLPAGVYAAASRRAAWHRVFDWMPTRIRPVRGRTVVTVAGMFVAVLVGVLALGGLTGGNVSEHPVRPAIQQPGVANARHQHEKRSQDVPQECAASEVKLSFDGVLVGGTVATVHVLVAARGKPCGLRWPIEFRIQRPVAKISGNPARIRLERPLTRSGTLALFTWGNWCGAARKLSGLITVGPLSKRFTSPTVANCVQPGKPSGLQSSSEPAP